MFIIHPFRGSERIGDYIRSNRWVYRYQSIDSALGYVLCANGKLRLNTLANMNDPRESRQWNFNLSSPNGWEEPSEASAYWVKLVRHALSHWAKVLCFSLDNPEYVGAPNEEFGRGYLKPRMWAQYGDNHKGVCLVFERKPLGNSIRQLATSAVFEGSVHYDYVGNLAGEPTYFQLDGSGHQLFSLPILVTGGNQELLQQIAACAKSYYFAKHDDWASEREYRWVALRADDEPVFVDVGNSLWV